ncbi:MAG: hypothetical protein HW376_973 [candidate division NC10 bacterium]|nr:hypothetical protein [candidate division NC10 bacterium]
MPEEKRLHFEQQRASQRGPPAGNSATQAIYRDDCDLPGKEVDEVPGIDGSPPRHNPRDPRRGRRPQHQVERPLVLASGVAIGIQGIKVGPKRHLSILDVRRLIYGLSVMGCKQDSCDHIGGDQSHHGQPFNSPRSSGGRHDRSPSLVRRATTDALIPPGRGLAGAVALVAAPAPLLKHGGCGRPVTPWASFLIPRCRPRSTRSSGC